MFEILQSTQVIISPEVNQAIHDVLYNGLQLLVLLITTAIGYAVKLAISQLKYKWQQDMALKLVRFAEQKYVDNTEKLNYVKSQIKTTFPRLTDEDVEHLVEASVAQLPKTNEIKASNTP